MENKNKGTLVGILIGIVFTLLAVGLLTSIKSISFTTNKTLDNEPTKDNNTNEEKSSNQDTSINQKTFEDIIENELYILFGYKSLNELPNERKLTLALNIIDNEYTTSSNDIYTTVENVSKTKVEEVFNKTSISKLGIKHQKFDVYDINDANYYRIDNFMSKRNLFNCSSIGKKVASYEEKNNQYIISMNYIFPDSCDGLAKYHGTYNYNNQNESNFIVKGYDSTGKYINPQEYIEANYETIKTKLDTYVYTFEVDKNNKINLVDFKIN